MMTTAPPGPDSGAITAAATILLVVVALAAYSAARDTLDEMSKQRESQRRIAETERTIALVEEATSPEKELLFGFFDFAADIDLSRAALEQLYIPLLKTRPPEIRQRRSADLQRDAGAVARYMREDLDGSVSGDRKLEERLRGKVLDATNFLERMGTLADEKSIDRGLLFDSQDYNIAGTYFVLEPVLEHFVNEENFDFEHIREFASAALESAKKWLPQDHGLQSATFDALRRENDDA